MVAYFLAGQEANACTQAWGVTSTSADALFPLANLTTGKPFEIFKFNAAGTDVVITYDMNVVVDASFEVGTTTNAPPSPWKVEAGTPTVETEGTEVDGTQSIRLNADNEGVYQDLTLIQGKRYRFQTDLFGDGTNNITVFLVDLDTGKYKTTASETSWSSSETVLFTRTTGTWATSTQNFTVDSQPSGGNGKSNMRIIIRKDGSGTAYGDLSIIYPCIDFAAMFDFNYHDSISCEVRSSNDNFVGNDTLEDTLPSNRFRSYIFFTPDSSNAKRWWRFKFSGTTLTNIPIFVGQPVLGEATSWNSPTYGSTIKYSMSQGGIDTANIRLPVSLTKDARLSLKMNFVDSTTDYDLAVEQILKPSGFGAEPVIFVPDSGRFEILHGRVNKNHSTTRSASSIYKHTIAIEEDPFSVVTK